MKMQPTNHALKLSHVTVILFAAVNTISDKEQDVLLYLDIGGILQLENERL